MTRPTRPPDVHDFIADLEATVALKEDALVRQFDLQLRANGGRAIYAIDGAILRNLFSRNRPRAEEAKTNKPPGLSFQDSDYQIFKGDRGSHAILVRQQRRLRDHILWYLLGDAPGKNLELQKLLLLPGHAEEVKSLFYEIVEGFVKQDRKISDAGIILEQLSEAKPGFFSEAENSRLLDALEQQLYDISEPHKRFERLNELVQRRQIVGLRAAALDESYSDDFLNSSGSHVFTQTEERHEGVGSLSWWKNELHQRLPKSFEPNDRRALAELDRINRSLEPTQARLILLTENKVIIETGKLYKPFKHSRTDIYAELSFSDLYIRHPRYFITDPDFVGAANPFEDTLRNSPSVIETWVDSFVATTSDDVVADRKITSEGTDCAQALISFRYQRQSIENRIRKDHRLVAIGANLTSHRRLSHLWSMFISRKAREFAAANPFRDTAIGEIFRRQSDGRNNAIKLDDAKRHIRRLAEESWSSFFTTTADVGFQLIDEETFQRTLIWPTPQLFLRGDGELQSLICSFWNPQFVKVAANDLMRDISAIEEPTLQQSYVHTLCYALLFANADRWTITKLLALRALEIFADIREVGERPGEISLFVTGREALYLYAVTHRVLGHSEEHYIIAQDALERASRARDPGDEGGPVEELSGIRLDAERIALDVDRAVHNNDFHPEVIDSLRSRILTSLKIVDRCRVDRVRLQTQLELRSTYFKTLAIEARNVSRSSLSSGVREELLQMVPEQLSAGLEIYSTIEAIPLRDQILIHLAMIAADFEVPPVLSNQSLEQLKGMEQLSRRMRIVYRTALEPIYTAIENWKR